MAFPDFADHRLYLPWAGVVVNRQDPEGLHRVKIRIPGLIDETRWAFPLTAGGGSPQRGGHIVPDVGADVVVQFLGGDEERPVYQAAHWGVRNETGNESPATSVDAGADAHLVQSMQVGPMVFTVDERPRDDQDDAVGQRFTITDVNAQREILVYDFAIQALTIQADYLVQLQSGGYLIMNGLITQMSGRTQKRGTVRQF